MKYSALQLDLLYYAAIRDLRERLSARHLFKKPFCDFPAEPKRVERQHSEIRELISAIRKLTDHARRRASK